MPRSSPSSLRAPRPQVQAFLRDIKANAGDNTPRLVLADWLQEHGDPSDVARGEFVHVQCQRARLSVDDPRREELIRRETALLAEHGAPWLGPLKYSEIVTSFERGLVHLKCKTQTLFSRRVLQMVGSELWEWVGGLDVWGGGRTEDRTPRLAPFLAGLTDLTLRSARIGAGDLHHLTQQADLGNLVSLRLPRNHIGTGGATALSHSPKLTRLTFLDLTGNDLHPNALKALGDADGLPNLTTLLLDGNWIGDRGLGVLAATMRLPRLTELHLASTGITAAGVAALAASPLLGQLTALDLSNNRLGDEGAAVLAAAPAAANLKRLVLDFNFLGTAGAEALAASPHLDRLEHLRVRRAAPLTCPEEAVSLLRERFGDRLVTA